MQTRALPRLCSVVFALGFAAMAAAHAYAQADTAAANTNVQIDALAIDGTTLTITGRNFGSAPSVFIGEETLAVSTNSDTQIVAATPQLSAGMHIVKVVRDSNEGGTGVSTLLVQ